MKYSNLHKFKFNTYLEKLYQSNKPLIIYKVDDGYDIYTDFSKKIILNNKNVVNFLNFFFENRLKKLFILLLVSIIFFEKSVYKLYPPFTL